MHSINSIASIIFITSQFSHFKTWDRFPIDFEYPFLILSKWHFYLLWNKYIHLSIIKVILTQTKTEFQAKRTSRANIPFYSSMSVLVVLNQCFCFPSLLLQAKVVFTTFSPALSPKSLFPCYYYILILYFLSSHFHVLVSILFRSPVLHMNFLIIEFLLTINFKWPFLL